MDREVNNPETTTTGGRPLCCRGNGRRGSFQELLREASAGFQLEQRTKGVLSYLKWHTPTTSADHLSAIVYSKEASLTHPNKNFSQGLLSHLYAKLNISRRPIASGSYEVKLKSSNDQQQGV